MARTDRRTSHKSPDRSLTVDRSMSPLPGEDRFSDETRALLVLLRSIAPIPEEDDPNGWFQQICDHLNRSPAERMEWWAPFADGVLRFENNRRGLPHVQFDPLRLLRLLSDHDVTFVVVGMGAGYLAGCSIPELQHRHHTTPGPWEHRKAGRSVGVVGC